MSICTHEWDQIHEESIIGGHYPVGWQCRKCNQFVRLDQLSPEGLPGQISGRNILVGPHGGRGNTSDGRTYRRQVLEADGTLTIER